MFRVVPKPRNIILFDNMACAVTIP